MTEKRWLYFVLGVTTVISLAFPLAANAQTKIGHINSQELLLAMPEMESAQKKLEKLAENHKSALEELTVEFNKKYEEYARNMEDTQNSMSDVVRTTKEAELQEMQQRIQAFKQQAEQDLKIQRMQLLQPIQDRAIAAAVEVAAENGFTYILDSGMGVIIYSAPDAQDILPMVKAKLGLK